MTARHILQIRQFFSITLHKKQSTLLDDNTVLTMLHAFAVLESGLNFKVTWNALICCLIQIC